MTKLSEVTYAVTKKYPSLLIGKIKGNAIKTHWEISTNNFGDCLSPYILKHYGFTPVYSQTADSDIILAGTILQWAPRDYEGIILGSGADDLELDFPNAKFIGVRGKKTLSNLIQKSTDVILGDPGLIVNKVFSEKIEKEYMLGIVPHFVDAESSIIKKWETRFGSEAKIIDVLRDAKDVINDIKSCHYILSSSLHGLITADAFGIPNIRFVNRKTMPTYFYDYKFDDYYSSLDSHTETIEANGEENIQEIIEKCRLHSQKVLELQEGLDIAFKNLKYSLKR